MIQDYFPKLTILILTLYFFTCSLCINSTKQIDYFTRDTDDFQIKLSIIQSQDESQKLFQINLLQKSGLLHLTGKFSSQQILQITNHKIESAQSLYLYIKESQEHKRFDFSNTYTYHIIDIKIQLVLGKRTTIINGSFQLIQSQQDSNQFSCSLSKKQLLKLKELNKLLKQKNQRLETVLYSIQSARQMLLSQKDLTESQREALKNIYVLKTQMLAGLQGFQKILNYINLKQNDKTQPQLILQFFASITNILLTYADLKNANEPSKQYLKELQDAKVFMKRVGLKQQRFISFKFTGLVYNFNKYVSKHYKEDISNKIIKSLPSSISQLKPIWSENELPQNKVFHIVFKNIKQPILNEFGIVFYHKNNTFTYIDYRPSIKTLSIQYGQNENHKNTISQVKKDAEKMQIPGFIAIKVNMIQKEISWYYNNKKQVSTIINFDIDGKIHAYVGITLSQQKQQGEIQLI